MASPVGPPTDRTLFVGREVEIAALRDLLARADVGLLTLTGIGGTGKTRLALAVAAEVADAFPDGVWFVDLEPVRDAAFVPTAIARTLNVDEQAGQPMADTLATALGPKLALMVLDNCEQVLDAMSIVGHLLARCPGLKVLATSRGPLGVHGEHEWPVAPLPVPDLSRLGSRPLDDVLPVLARSPAVALFVARAQAASPSFMLTVENVPAVVDLCRGLDGLPLAIELAAGRTRVLSPAAMVDRLDQRLSLLTGGGRDRPARQQTMRDSLAWSYELLAAEEQAVLRRLAVFVGGFTVAAAEAVGGASPPPRTATLDGAAPPAGGPTMAPAADLGVLAALDALVAQCLVRPLGQVAGAERFGLLETLRAFALEALAAAGEEAAAHRALAVVVATMAEQAGIALQGPEFDAWMGRLDAELGNIRAAMAWSLGAGGDAALALRIAGSLRIYWDVRGQIGEGRRWLDQALALPGPADETRRKALNAAGLLAWRHVDTAAARAHFEAARALARQQGDRAAEGTIIGNLGLLAYEGGHFELARERFEECLAIARQGTDVNSIAAALNNVGVTWQAEGELANARSCFSEAVALYGQGGDRQLLTDAVENLAILDGEMGDLGAAIAGLEEVLAVRRERGDRRGVATTLARLSQLFHLKGRIGAAARLIGDSLIIHRDVGDTRGLVESVEHAATLAGWPLLRPLHRQPPIVAGGAVPLLDDLRLAVRLMAAMHSHQAVDPVALTVAEQRARDANLAVLRSNLGRRAFDASWATGESLCLDGAVAEALGLAARLAAQPDPEAGAGAPAGDAVVARPSTSPTSIALVDNGGLTPREIEVATLIAGDLTYRQIAERMGLSVKSIEKHMGSILAKLGARNRLEVAAWARARRLGRGGPPAGH